MKFVSIFETELLDGKHCFISVTVVILGVDRSSGILWSFSVSHHYVVTPLSEAFPPKSRMRTEAHSPGMGFIALPKAPFL